jgi:hypothetical protein
LAGVVVVCQAGTAAARDDFGLDYERGPGAGSCADGDALRAAVTARLGYDPFVAREDVDTLVVRIGAGAGGKELKGSIERRDAAHRLRGRASSVTSKSGDCGELVAALAVGIAIVIDPMSLMRAEATPPLPPPSPLHVPVPDERAARVGDREAPGTSGTGTGTGTGTWERQRGLRGVGGVGPSITLGVLPQIAPALVVWGGIARGPFELDAGARLAPPASVAGAGGGSVQAALYVATLAPCLRYRFLLGCVEIALGALQGAGLGFDHTRTDSTLYASLGALAGVEFAIARHVALRVVVEGMAPLRPTRLVANGAQVWSTPALGGSASPTLVVSFP